MVARAVCVWRPHLDRIEDSTNVPHDERRAVDVLMDMLASVAQQLVAAGERLAVLADGWAVPAELDHLFGGEPNLAAEHLEHAWRRSLRLKKG